MKELWIRRMRNLSFAFLFATAWMTAGEPLAASLSNCDTVYNSYSQALGSGSCHKRFTVRDASRHHHVPLLLNPFGYSTYRGT